MAKPEYEIKTVIRRYGSDDETNVWVTPFSCSYGTHPALYEAIRRHSEFILSGLIRRGFERDMSLNEFGKPLKGLL